MRPDIDTGNQPPQYRIQSAYDALRLLEIIVSTGAGLNASELALRVGEHRNRVFRLLRTLEEAGYILQNPTTRAYRPTLKLVSLGHTVSRSHDLEVIATPIMEALRSRTGETVYLVGRDGDEAVALINLESSHLNRISAQPGRRWPLGQGAAGQALLLMLPEQRQYLERHPEMLEPLEGVRIRFEAEGVTFVDGRHDDIHDEGVMAIATPISSHAGILQMALAVAWPISRSTVDYAAFRSMLLESASVLRRAFGFDITGIASHSSYPPSDGVIGKEGAATD